MFNKEDLDKKVEEKLLIRQSHPTLPLSIYNYSQTTQYTGAWDEITLSSRGLIVDDETGEVIIKPFPKFFNYEEVADEVPWDTSTHVHVQKKMDGSLGILFNYKGEWILATRGSFTSDQAVRGMEILRSKYNLDNFIKHVAYLVEIIFPQNRIVVDYGEDERIFFLSATPNLHYPEWADLKGDGKEFNYATSEMLFHSSEIDKEDVVEGEMIHKDLDHSIYENLKSMNTENEEGYVLRFYPSNFRCKIKFSDYVRLHRIVTQVSSYDVWEHLMKNGKLPEEFLTMVPDEFYKWVKETAQDLQTKFTFLKSLHFAVVSSTLRDAGIERSQMAEEFMYQSSREPKLNTGVLFYIADGKNVDEKIWKMIKPEYQRPFQEKG
jgi:tRNA splicing ligase